MPSAPTGTPGRLKLLKTQAIALREARDRLGLTQEQSAAQWAVKVETYRSWEHGLRQPNEETRTAIADAWAIDGRFLGIGRCPCCGRPY
jgi:ribosome-binding protein aMBF1 (putative translation factor)